MTISFKTTKEELKKIVEIRKRARDLDLIQDIFSFEMDLAATHANGCPLDFQKLIDFPDFDFGHDVIGILNNLNRETGKLENCFLPRCSK